jgi:kumamolisin
MSEKTKIRHSVSGSERVPLPGARLVGPIDPNEKITVTLVLRRRSGGELAARLNGQEVRPLTRAQFASTHGAAHEDIGKIEAFAHDHQLNVDLAEPAQRRVVLSGTVAAMSQAFGVHLGCWEHPLGTSRGRTGEVHVPDDIAPIVEAVLGLDNRPQARAQFRRAKGGIMAHAAAATRSFTPVELAKLYTFPNGATGRGQTVAIIELGGGYRTSDLKTYFRGLGLRPPAVVAIGVDHGGNHPGDEADAEVCLDIEVVGAVAPGARIAVYFAPNTDQGFYDAIATAIHDPRRQPSVVSISWGGPEIAWTEQAMRAMDALFQDAAALGVTICAAAGDDGSSDIRDESQDDGNLHVDFPASSPFALACGGTRLEAANGAIASETVWNEGRQDGATGGGVSEVFELPSWQSASHVPQGPGGHAGRGVPDVSGDADPLTGYVVRVDGRNGVIGGTSAVAPLWAGLAALLNEKLGRPVGYLNPVLYRLAVDSFRDIQKGDNDISGGGKLYQAGPGWDPCTGLGSPNGAALLEALQAESPVA